MDYFDSYSILNSKQRKNEIFCDIADEVSDGKIPNDLAQMLISENRDKDYKILIHRSSKTTSEQLFEDGLIIAGGNDLSYTTSEVGNDLLFMQAIVRAYAYKNYGNDKAICAIIKIPQKDLKYIKGETKPILFQTDDIAEQGGGMISVPNETQTVLLPEYIMGAVEYDKGRIVGFKRNERYSDIHDYKNDGLEFVGDVYYDYMKKNNIEGVSLFSKREKEAIRDKIANENDEYERNKKNVENGRSILEVKEYAMNNMTRNRFMGALNKLGRLFGFDSKGDERDDRD